MTPIVFLDTETNGVHPGRKVWEVAAIRRDDEGEQTYHVFAAIDLSTADPFGLKVGGFYERHPLGIYLSSPNKEMEEPDPEFHPDDTYVLPGEAAIQITRLTHGAHIVGAVPNFDTEVLAALLRQYELTPAWHYHLIDVEGLAVGYLAGRDSVLREQGDVHAPPIGLPWKSDELSRALGVSPPGEDERHTALGDARWAMRLYDAIVGAA